MNLSNAIEIGGGTKWSIHFISVIEESVIDLVFAGFLSEGDNRLEPMTPKNLRWQVRASRLRRHTSRFDYPYRY